MESHKKSMLDIENLTDSLQNAATSFAQGKVSHNRYESDKLSKVN